MGFATKLIVLTDLHMVPAGERIIGIDPDSRLKAAVRHINATHPDADGVIVTGDLTHHGDVKSYRRVRRRLEKLTPPCHLQIGNHDRRDAFLKVFPETPRDRNGFVQQAFDAGPYRLVLLDTLAGPPYSGHAGQLCADRLAFFDAQLAAAAGRPVIVFLHHPPHRTGFPGMDLIALMDGEVFYDVAARYGNVRHIVAGHLHRTVSGSYRGVPFSIFKSPVHQQPMDLHAEESSLSVDEPAAYGVILLDPDCVIVHTEDYELAPVRVPQQDPPAR